MTNARGGESTAFKNLRTRVKSRRPDILAVALVVAIVLVAFSPVLLLGRTFSGASFTPGANGFDAFPAQKTVGISGSGPSMALNSLFLDPGASAWQFEPWAQVTHAELRNGHLPLWNPYQGAGSPLAANLQSGALSPLLLPVNLHPSPFVWDISTIALYVLSAIATYCFVRVVGLRYAGSVVAAVAYALSGYFFLYANNQFVRTYVAIPFIFLSVEWVLRSGRILAIACLGAAVASCILVGMPEAAFLCVAFGAGFACVRSFWGPRRGSRRAAFLGALIGFIAGGLLAAPVLLPFYEYQHLSFNLHTNGSAVGLQADPVSGALNWLFPFLNGDPQHAFLPPHGWDGTRNWVGGAVLALAAAALAGRQRQFRVWTLFFSAASFAMVAKAYGVSQLQWLGRLPVLRLVSFPAFGLPIASFAFAILAGFGVHAIETRVVDARRLVIASFVALVLVAYLMAKNHNLLSQLPFTYATKRMLPGFLASGVIVLVAFHPRLRAAGAIAGTALVAELLVLTPFHGYAERANPFQPAPAWVAPLQRMIETHAQARVFGIDGKLLPDSAGVYQLQDIRVIDGLYVDRYWRYISSFVQPLIRTRFVGGTIGAAEETQPSHYLDNPMFNLLGVRYIVSGHALAPAESQGLSIVEQDGHTWIYENERALPRAFVVHDIRTTTNSMTALQLFEAASDRGPDGALQVTRLDPAKTAIVEAASHSFASRACTNSTRDNTTIVSYGPDQVTLDIESACDGLAVLTDTYYPGWRATVNGHASQVVPVDLAFRGVAVSSGHSRVVFRYKPDSFRRGVLLANLAGASLLAAGVVKSLRRRRFAT